jgi:hypothetical protein
MNGSRAKSIRRTIYGDNSTKVSNRKYGIKHLGQRLIKFVVRDGRVFKDREFYADRSIVRSEGLRRKYQQAKRQWKLTRTLG